MTTVVDTTSPFAPDPAAPPETTRPRPYEPIKFRLNTPIKAGTIDTLVLKMPTGEAFLKFGNPQKLVQLRPSGLNANRNETRTEVGYDFAAVIGFAAIMSGVDQIACQSISGNDLLRLADAIMGIISYDPLTS